MGRMSGPFVRTGADRLLKRATDDEPVALFVPIHPIPAAHVGQRFFDRFRIFAGLEPVDDFVELRWQIFAELITHTAHHPGHRPWVFFVHVPPRIRVAQAIEARLLGPGEAYPADQTLEVPAPTIGADDLALPVFLIGLINGDAFPTIATTVLVRWHRSLHQIDYTGQIGRLQRVLDDLLNHQRQPLLIVISGPSGVGKDTVLQRMKERQLPFHFVVTATTRALRPGEVDGKDYIFISRDQFAEMIEAGQLLEHAFVYNDYKGIPRQQVQQALASGQDVVMRLDVQGADTIRKLCPDALMIFLTARTEDELVDRLRIRRTEDTDNLKLRIATAREELKRLDIFDYLVVNPDQRLDDTVDIIMAIINAEHHRTHPRVVQL